MNLKHLLLIAAVGSVLAPNAMAKGRGPMRTKQIQVKHVAGKVKKAPVGGLRKATKNKKSRKSPKAEGGIEI